MSLPLIRDNFDTIINTSPDIIFIVDNHSKLIKYNSSFEQYFDNKLEINLTDNSSISHLPFISYIIDHDITNIHKYYSSVVLDYENNIFSGQTFYEQFGSKKNVYLYVIVKLFYNNEKIIGGIELIRNITHSVNIQDELYKHNKKIQNLFNIIPNGYLKLDSEGNFTEYDGNLNVLSFNPDSIIGKSIYDDICSSISKSFIDSIRRSRELSIPTQTEYSLNLNDKTKHFLVKNVPIDDEVISVIHDITEQKELKYALDEQKNNRLYTLHQFVLTLMSMLKFNDPCTYYHQLRVAHLASHICKKLNFSQLDTKHVITAAKLHDIGKIAMPFDILNKSDSLTISEHSAIRKHPTISFNLIKNLPFDLSVKIYIHQHHEHLDGTGYPYGLFADDILMGSRILTVCDDVETLLSYRSYKMPISIQESLTEITSGSGVIYDTSVVRACEELFLEGYEFPS